MNRPLKPYSRLGIFAVTFGCLFLAQANAQRQYAVDQIIGTQELRTRDIYLDHVVPVAGGKLLVLGGFDYVDNSRWAGRLVGLDSTGRFDPTFYPSFALIMAVAVAPGGDIWALGSDDYVHFRVAKLRPDGAPVPGMSTGEVSPSVSLMAAADGGFYAIDRSGGRVNRFTSEAKPADGFSPISVGNKYISGWALSPLGEIALLISQASGNEVLVFSATGALEPYATGWIPPDFFCYSIAYDSVGRLLVGAVGTGQPKPILIRLLPNGIPDGGFSGVIPNIYGAISSISLMPDGRVVAAGSVGNATGVLEFSSEGVFERLVSTTASGHSVGLTGVYPVDSSRYIVLGGFDYIGGVQRGRIAEVFFGGAVSPDFTPQLEGLAQVNSVARSPGGEVLFGGYVTRVGQVSIGNLAGLSSTGDVEVNFPSIEWATNSIVPTQDGGALILGAFPPLPGTMTSGLAKLRADHTVDTGFLAGTSLWGVDCALALPDGSTVLGGQFGQFNGSTVASLLTRVTPQGTIDPTFFNQSPATTWQTVSAIAAHPAGGFLIAGTFTEFQGEARAGVARVANNGLVDHAFVPEAALVPGGWPRNMTVLADGRFYLLGQQIAFPKSSSSMMRFAANGTLDPAFTSPFETVLSYCVASDGTMFVAGINESANPGQGIMLVRILANGQFDPNFAFSLDGSVAALVPGSDGSLIVGGRFTEVGGLHREGLARIVPVPLSVAIDGPSLQTVALRGSITLSARAVSANGPVSYQWYHDGALIRGANTDKLDINRVAPKDAGEYKVAVTAAGEKALSPAVTLSVIKGSH